MRKNPGQIEEMPRVSISLWTGLIEFNENGIIKEYDPEFDQEAFEQFVFNSPKYLHENFIEAGKLVDEEPVVRIATPKPATCDFNGICNLCDSALHKENIHISVGSDVDGGKEVWICKSCFLTLPFGDGKGKDHVVE